MSTPLRPPRLGTALRLALAAAACVSTAGCLPVLVRGTSGRPLPLERVQAIRPEATTARELIEWLGPPLAVGPPDAVFRVPVLGVRKVGSKDVTARPEKGAWTAETVRPGDLVYYWEAVEIRDGATEYDVYPGWRLMGTLRRRTCTDRLWVLVSNEGRRVRALAHDRQETGPPRDEGPGPEEQP